MLHETDLAKQRAAGLQFDKRVLDEEAHYIHSFWWNRLVPLRSYVHGWKIGPSHYSNQDLGDDLAGAAEMRRVLGDGTERREAGRSDSEIVWSEYLSAHS